MPRPSHMAVVLGAEVMCLALYVGGRMRRSGGRVLSPSGDPGGMCWALQMSTAGLLHPDTAL
jgi:hypothetical protein